MVYEIIDFHTHPFGDSRSNICAYAPSEMEDPVSYSGNAKRLLML